MKKIEGVVVYYDDGSRERISAKDIMARFFAPVPRQESTEKNLRGVGIPPIEPEKNIQPIENTLGNESFPQESHFSESSTTGLNPGNGNSDENPGGLKSPTPTPSKKKKDWESKSLSNNEKDYRDATIYLFPYGGDRLRNKSLLECVLLDRAFMEKVAQNSKGKNAELARHIRLVLDRNPEREGESL